MSGAWTPCTLSRTELKLRPLLQVTTGSRREDCCRHSHLRSTAPLLHTHMTHKNTSHHPQWLLRLSQVPLSALVTLYPYDTPCMLLRLLANYILYVVEKNKNDDIISARVFYSSATSVVSPIAQHTLDRRRYSDGCSLKDEDACCEWKSP